MLSLRRYLLLVATAPLMAFPAAAEVLYRYDGGLLFDGAFGPVARMQARLAAELAACGSSVKVSIDGKFGKGTRDALAELSSCPRFARALVADGDAKAGALTALYWERLVGGATPSMDERARTLMLSFEATDYTRAEWNFCQTSPLYDPKSPNPICYSNDPRSYLTWGPNGATAGNGREIQLILQALDHDRPDLVTDSFGEEATAVRRMYVLADGRPSRSLETYLCGIWASPVRRAAWRDGFATLGRDPTVRAIFDRMYSSRALDGGKISTFYRAYLSQGLTPTEIDYGFFKDRAAHTTPIEKDIRVAIRSATVGGAVAAWKVRRAIARQVRPANQREDRLGRDVAYYVDGASRAGLDPEELAAWRKRGMRTASAVGLSDERQVAKYVAGDSFPTAIGRPAELSAQERAACPQAVLDTRRPADNR